MFVSAVWPTIFHCRFPWSPLATIQNSRSDYVRLQHIVSVESFILPHSTHRLIINYPTLIR